MENRILPTYFTVCNIDDDNKPSASPSSSVLAPITIVPGSEQAADGLSTTAPLYNRPITAAQLSNFVTTNMNAWTSFLQLTAPLPIFFKRRTRPSPFAAAPVELVRAILLEAAHISPATAARLALVSKSVRAWVEPVLYAHVSLTTPSPYAFLSKDPAFLAAHVKALTLTPADPAAKHPGFPPAAALSALAALHTLTLHAAHLPALRAPALHLAPAELVVRGAVGYAALHWEAALLGGVRRLVFADDCPRHVLGDVRALTHFACAWAGAGELPLLRAVLDLPGMRVVVVHVRGEAKTGKELEGLARDVRVEDKRVLFVSGAVPDADGGYAWGWAEAALKRGTRFVDAEALAKLIAW
ncbi:hypothetical protein HWV62_11846 [Athelia sp. TMB]|nr:hypothetical protein HWV62_11846 [Athelia sp. TMB]